MLKSYFIMALRHLRRAKGSTAINVLSFAAALSCCSIIGLYIRYELSYDRFHDHADRVVRLVTETEGPFAHRSTTSPPGLAGALPDMYPEVAAATSVSGFRTGYVGSSDRQHPASDFYFADSLFFDVFAFPLLAGDPRSALDPPDAMVLAEPIAEYFFPEGNAVGRTLRVGSMEWTVTGISRVPSNSHLRFNFLARTRPPFTEHSGPVDWRGYGRRVYAVLTDPAAAPALVAKLNVLAAEQDIRPATSLTFSAQRLTDIHLRSRFEDDFGSNGDVRYVYLLAVLAVLLLVVAAINFINLATARYSARALEVGVRKVLGAHRGQLMRQFIGESILLTVGAGLVTLAAVLLLRPLVSSFTGKPLQFYPADAIFLLVLVAALGLLAGSYPAFFLSRFRPVAVLKGVFRTGSGDVRLRRLLIGIQLCATIGLATGAAVIYMQIRHLQTTRLGFDKEHVLAIDSWTGIGRHYAALKEELLREPAVAAVTTGYRPGHSSGGSRLEGDDGQYWLLHRYPVGYDYIETLGIRLLAGRTFSADHPSDSAQAVILSESAVARMGLEEPVLGRRLEVGGANNGREIIGVVEDFNVLSYRDPVAPVMITLGTGDVIVKLRPGDVREAVRRVEAVYDRFQPDRPMVYSFLDDQYEALFQEERRFGTLFSLFSLVAALVALLGLTGLASYTVERRTREIGIRQVLGAGPVRIVRLIAGEFVWLTLAASALAVPFSYFLAKGWLDEFVVRIDLAPTLPGAIVATALGLVVAVVATQAARAARGNPADALRYD